MSILGLTYAAYTCYHLSRKPISVVKNVLNQNCSDYPVPNGFVFNNVTNKENWCDWAPFGKLVNLVYVYFKFHITNN